MEGRHFRLIVEGGRYHVRVEGRHYDREGGRHYDREGGRYYDREGGIHDWTGRGNMGSSCQPDVILYCTS